MKRKTYGYFGNYANLVFFLKMEKYRIYIDEVGNPDVESSDNPNHRFLSLTGVIIDLEYVRNVL